MKISKILSAGLVALSLGAFAGTAHATAYVFNISLDPADAVTGTVTPGPFSARARAWTFSSQFTPFAVSNGDTIEVIASFTSPITLEANNLSFPMGNRQFAGVSFNNGLSSPGFNSFNIASTTFSGTSGSFFGNPPPFVTNTSFPGGSEILQASSPFANLTNSTMSFTGVDIFINVMSISSQSAPFNVGFFQVLDELNPVSAPVPAPGAFALLGLGLLSIGGLRRKRKAA